MINFYEFVRVQLYNIVEFISKLNIEKFSDGRCGIFFNVMNMKKGFIRSKLLFNKSY